MQSGGRGCRPLVAVDVSSSHRALCHVVGTYEGGMCFVEIETYAVEVRAHDGGMNEGGTYDGGTCDGGCKMVE